MVLTVLREAYVILQPKKCTLFTNRINYLGHVLRPNRLEVSNHTADAIRELNVPTTVTELRSFLELSNMLRRFVPNFAGIVSPLFKWFKKNQDKELGTLNEEELNAFGNLKEKLISPPVLTLPKRENTIHLILSHVIVKLVVSCFRSKKTVKTDRSDIGHARKVSPRRTSRPRNESASQLFELFLSYDSILKEQNSLLGPVIMRWGGSSIMLMQRGN